MEGGQGKGEVKLWMFYLLQERAQNITRHEVGAQ